jgi:hypothetical protein
MITLLLEYYDVLLYRALRQRLDRLEQAGDELHLVHHASGVFLMLTDDQNHALRVLIHWCFWRPRGKRFEPKQLYGCMSTKKRPQPGFI